MAVITGYYANWQGESKNRSKARGPKSYSSQPVIQWTSHPSHPTKDGKRPFLTLGFSYPLDSSCQKDLPSLYHRHENEKKREYAQRVWEVKRGEFIPLVFASTGGMARECTTVFRRIADILSDKKMLYSQVIHLIRCWLSFVLIRSAIRATRGSWRSRQPTVTDFNQVFTEASDFPLNFFTYILSLSQVLFAIDKCGRCSVVILYHYWQCECVPSVIIKSPPILQSQNTDHLSDQVKRTDQPTGQ